jgi:hypothetical protein
VLGAIRTTADGATESSLGDLRPSSDPDRYSSLFENPKVQLAFQSERSDVLLSRYFPFGRWFLHMTPLKWAIAVIGGLAALVVILAIVRLILAARVGASTVPR